MDSVILTVFADLLINLSAGWFAAALIIPPLAKRKGKTKWGLLLLNILSGIISLFLAYWLRVEAQL